MFHKTILLLYVVFVLCLSLTTRGEEPPRSGDAFPDQIYTHTSLADRLKDQVVLVDFWATWCAPCKNALPALNNLHRAYARKGFTVLGINIDKTEKKMHKFLSQEQISFPIFYDQSQTIVSQMQIATMPSSFLIDRNGIIRFMHKGFHGEKTIKELQKQIEELLNE